MRRRPAQIVFAVIAVATLAGALAYFLFPRTPLPPIPPAERVIIKTVYRESAAERLQPEDLRREMHFQMICPVNADWCELEVRHVSPRMQEQFGFEAGDRLLGYNGRRAEANLRYALDIIGFQLGLTGDDIHVHIRRDLERVDIIIRFAGPLPERLREENTEHDARHPDD